MNEKNKSFRSPLGRIRGLGSAKGGTEHWWLQRLTSVALIPLSIYAVIKFFTYAVFGGQNGALYWLHNPVDATLMILFLAVAFHHAANGLQEVIEDYVHCECAKLAGIMTVKFAAAALAILGILAVVMIMFGV